MTVSYVPVDKLRETVVRALKGRGITLEEKPSSDNFEFLERRVVACRILENGDEVYYYPANEFKAQFPYDFSAKSSDERPTHNFVGPLLSGRNNRVGVEIRYYKKTA